MSYLIKLRLSNDDVLLLEIGALVKGYLLPTLGWKYRYRAWGTPWARCRKWSLVCPFTVTSDRKIRVTFSEFGVASIETVDDGTFVG